MDGSEKTEVRYHLVRTLPRRERDVAQALRVERKGVTAAGRSGLGLTTLLPIERVAGTRRGRRTETDRPLFSTLCLVAWDPDDLGLWHEVRDTPGVVAILTRDERPIPVSDQDLRQLLELLDEDHIYVPSPDDKSLNSFGFSGGDLVRFEAGPFTGYQGTCHWVDPRVGTKIRISGTARSFDVFVRSEDVVGTLSRIAPTESLPGGASGATRRGHRSHKARLARIPGRHRSESNDPSSTVDRHAPLPPRSSRPSVHRQG